MDTELTLENVIPLLDKRYELVYIDRDSNFDDSLDKIQEAIHNQSKDELYDHCNNWWLWEAQSEGLDYAIGELKKEIVSVHGVDDEVAEEFLDANIDTIREKIEERDESSPVDDMIRNTSNPVCFYDTGVEFCETGFDEQQLAENIDELKQTLNIQTDKYDKRISIMLQQASYGGRLVIYFTEDIQNLINIGDNNTIHFQNPMIAVIDTYGGSGDSTDLHGHEFDLPLDVKNLFLDKTIKYNYTYEVCGMYDSWCYCTSVKFLKLDNVPLANKSSLYAELEVEDLYNKAFKAGGCTFGDMDMRRHRNTYYVNDFPCGTHCPKCSTFWID